MLILAHVAGAALGEEMGGPSPYPAAALPSVPVQPGFGLLQVGGRSQSQWAAVLNRLDRFMLDGSAYRPRKFNPPAVTFHSLRSAFVRNAGARARFSMQERVVGNAAGRRRAARLWSGLRNEPGFLCRSVACVMYIHAAPSLALKRSYSRPYCLPCGLDDWENL